MNPAEFEDGPGRIEPHNGLPCYNPASLPPELELTSEILDAYGDALYALGQLSTVLIFGRVWQHLAVIRGVGEEAPPCDAAAGPSQTRIPVVILNQSTP